VPAYNLDQIQNCAKDTSDKSHLMPLTHAPETSTENLYWFSAGVSCKSVSIFFRYQNLVRSRTVFYLVQETMTKMTNTDWLPVVVVCLYKVCLLFYCFKMNWGDSSIERLIKKFCFQFHLVRKTGTRKVRVFGTSFWCVCHWHYTC